MKFATLATLIAPTAILHAASRATAECAKSLDAADQTFEYAGQRFNGPDAIIMKRALLSGLDTIAINAKAELVRGGVKFPADPKPKTAKAQK